MFPSHRNFCFIYNYGIYYSGEGMQCVCVRCTFNFIPPMHFNPPSSIFLPFFWSYGLKIKGKSVLINEIHAMKFMLGWKKWKMMKFVPLLCFHRIIITVFFEILIFRIMKTLSPLKLLIFVFDPFLSCSSSLFILYSKMQK